MIDAYILHREDGDHLLTTEEAAAFQYVTSRTLRFSCKLDDPFRERLCRIEERDFRALVKICEVADPENAITTAKSHVLWADMMFQRIERVTT